MKNNLQKDKIPDQGTQISDVIEQLKKKVYSQKEEIEFHLIGSRALYLHFPQLSSRVDWEKSDWDIMTTEFSMITWLNQMKPMIRAITMRKSCYNWSDTFYISVLLTNSPAKMEFEINHFTESYSLKASKQVQTEFPGGVCSVVDPPLLAAFKSTHTMLKHDWEKHVRDLCALKKVIGKEGDNFLASTECTDFVMNRCKRTLYFNLNSKKTFPDLPKDFLGLIYPFSTVMKSRSFGIVNLRKYLENSLSCKPYTPLICGNHQQLSYQQFTELSATQKNEIIYFEAVLIALEKLILGEAGPLTQQFCLKSYLWSLELMSTFGSEYSDDITWWFHREIVNQFEEFELMCPSVALFEKWKREIVEKSEETSLTQTKIEINTTKNLVREHLMFPGDCWMEIFSFISDPKDFFHLSLVNKQFYSVLRTMDTWKKLYAKRWYPNTSHLLSDLENVNWCEIYVKRHTQHELNTVKFYFYFRSLSLSFPLENGTHIYIQ
jgi:hypothetical protein